MNVVVFEVELLGSKEEDWEGLKNHPLVTSFKKHVSVTEKQILEKAKDADLIITNCGTYRAETLSALPSLQYLGLMTTGYNHVDIDMAHQQNLIVTNIPAYGTMSVAQHVMGLLLEICCKVGFYNEAVKRTYWQEEDQFMFRIGRQFELDGKTIGIFGLGNIGFAVAKMAQGFGMKVLAYSRYKNPAYENTSIEYVTKDELFARSDVITLNASLSEDTYKAINDESIEKMKPGVIILNAARGEMIDEEALARGIYSGKVYAAGLDTLSEEPPKPSNPLLGLPQCIITPHMAWSTQEAMKRIIHTAVDNALSFLEGSPVNVK